MLDFLANNIGTIVIALLLGVVVAAVVTAMVKSKKSGGSACGGGCSGCPFSGKCQGAEGGTNDSTDK